MPFPFTHQHDAMDCGPACLQMIAKHYGKNFRLKVCAKNCIFAVKNIQI